MLDGEGVAPWLDDCVGDGEATGLADVDWLGVPEWLSDGVTVVVSEGVTVGLADIDCEGVTMALDDPVPVAAAVGVAVELDVDFWVAETVCERDEA